MTDFVHCLSPLSTKDQLADASAAALALHGRFTRLAQASEVAPTSLLAAVTRRAALAGWIDQEAIIANLIGLLSQPMTQVPA